jgi:hypothetical protein
VHGGGAQGFGDTQQWLTRTALGQPLLLCWLMIEGVTIGVLADGFEWGDGGREGWVIEAAGAWCV